MRRQAAALLLSASICLILAAPAMAEGTNDGMQHPMNEVHQTGTTINENVRDLKHDVKRDTIRTNSFDDTGIHRTNWGWLGLIGLVGLAGLMNRNREPRR
ncbi:WGxxGxxG family protein [Paenibacillus chibensis]|nr:WGxxGxxG family protein [Paenibacillus chibensis]MEC0369288.1 WGxxGxxG-CTERM domain-containing protein [Paenibacillus chibensis]